MEPVAEAQESMSMMDVVVSSAVHGGLHVVVIVILIGIVVMQWRLYRLMRGDGGD